MILAILARKSVCIGDLCGGSTMSNLTRSRKRDYLFTGLGAAAGSLEKCHLGLHKIHSHWLVHVQSYFFAHFPPLDLPSMLLLEVL